MTLTKFLSYGQLLCVVVMLVGLSGVRLQWLPFKMAFGGFSLAVLCAALLAIIALIIIGLSYFNAFGLDSAARPGAATAFVLGATPLIVIVFLVGKGFSVPKIHNISTNTEDNIAFVHAPSLRKLSDNSLDFPEAEVVELQRRYYPEVQTMLAMEPSDEAFARVLEVADALGWSVTFQDPERGLVEATESTAVFGFVDDIAVRVTPTITGSKIDMRSVSRVGLSDLGANAARILRFQEAYRRSAK